MNKIDRTGLRNGRLVVIAEAETIKRSGRSRVYWLCKCDCGNEVKIVSDGLSSTKSCGCILKEIIGSVNLKHGEANKTKENRAWQHIQSRCYSKTNPKYPVYGGRGIKVCNRWLLSYEDFLSDMGRAPSKQHSIDRIDVNGNYEPSNCRWATNIEQANNKTTNVNLSYNGVTLTMKQWANTLNLKYKWLHAQLRYKGKTLEDFIYG